MATSRSLRGAAHELVWKLLDHLHTNLNSVRDERAWEALFSDDLVRCRELVSAKEVTLEDLQAARALWDWHLQYDRGSERQRVAKECEDAYLTHPIVAVHAPLFGSRSFGNDDQKLIRAVAGLAAPLAVSTVAQFISDAVLFTSTHADQWRANQVHQFAWLLGEQRGAEASVKGGVHDGRSMRSR